MSTSTRPRAEVWVPAPTADIVVGDFVRLIHFPRPLFGAPGSDSARVADGEVTARTDTHVTIAGVRRPVRLSTVQVSSRRVRNRADAERALRVAEQSLARAESRLAGLRADVDTARALLDEAGD